MEPSIMDPIAWPHTTPRIARNRHRRSHSWLPRAVSMGVSAIGFLAVVGIGQLFWVAVLGITPR